MILLTTSINWQLQKRNLTTHIHNEVQTQTALVKPTIQKSYVCLLENSNYVTKNI